MSLNEHEKNEEENVELFYFLSYKFEFYIFRRKIQAYSKNVIIPDSFFEKFETKCAFLHVIEGYDNIFSQLYSIIFRGLC